LAGAFRTAEIDPLANRTQSAIEAIGTRIDQVGQGQVNEATTTAERAAQVTLLALGIALAAALVLGGWLTRSLVGPIQRLRHGMAVVAAGDFNPQLEEIPERPDEIGDLGHSFHRMTEQL